MVTFTQLADVYEKLEKTSSGNELRRIIAAFFKKVPKQEIGMITYLSTGRIAADFADINLGMASKMVLKSIALAAQKEQAEVNNAYKKFGDVGKTAEHFVGKKRKHINVKQVFETLHQIARTSGKGSVEKKQQLLADLFHKASPKEAKYIARITLGTLRLGVAEATILDALSLAYTGSKEAKKDLEHAYNICPDIGIIASTFAKRKLKGIRTIGMALGRPIQVMLCQRIPQLEHISSKMNFPVVVEEKYDGERIQVHKKGNAITLFSRRLEDITNQFPDVVQAVKKQVKAKNIIFEGEALPVDKKGKLLPFQVLMQRRRKHDVEKYVKKVPIKLFVFDVLYKNGKSLIRQPYEKRYQLLKSSITGKGLITNTLQKKCKDVKCIEDLFQKVVKVGGEGVIIKDIKGEYQAGARGWNWIKWKPEYSKKLRDTFDVVVIGAIRGRGRRAEVYGSLLCAVYNKKKDRFDSFTKVGTGFTDRVLAELPKKLKKYLAKKRPARVAKPKLTPDVWFQPRMVIELAGTSITKSPTHTAGYALRFPKFLRFRPDKKPEQATSLKEILRMAQK